MPNGRRAAKLRIIDHYEVNNIGLEHVVEKVKRWKDREGRSATNTKITTLPHDVGDQRASGPATRICLQILGGSCGDSGKVQVVPKLPIVDGINAVRRDDPDLLV